MKKSDKGLLIQELKEKFENSDYFYIADSSNLSVAKINEFRRACFEKDIEVRVVKNTLAIKAIQQIGEERNLEPLVDVLKGPSTLMFTETANLPAKVIKDFRKKDERPMIKAAYIDSGIYLGDDQIDALVALKSKDELIAEIIGLLQSPAKNVIGALQSGGSTLAGIGKTLQEREEN